MFTGVPGVQDQLGRTALVRFRKKGFRRFRADVTGADDPIVPLRAEIPGTGCESLKRIA